MPSAMWIKFLNGPLYISDIRFEALRVAMSPKAIDLFRNFKRLYEQTPDHKFLAAQIVNCLNPETVPPYIFYMAEKKTPFYREEIHTAMKRAKYPEFKGNLCILIDLSRNMLIRTAMGITQMELGACYASAGTCKNKRVFTVSNYMAEVKGPVEGLGGIDKILASQPYAACNIDHAIKDVHKLGKFDQVVVYSHKAFHLSNKLVMPQTVTIH